MHAVTHWIALFFLLGIALGAGCTGSSSIEPSGAGGTGAVGATGTGAATGATGPGGSGGSGGSGGGWSQCSSPSGYRICGGPHGCPTGPPECPLCAHEAAALEGEVSICLNEALHEFGCCKGCYLCPDGALCLEFPDSPGAFLCAPYELAVLFEMNGAIERVHCVDFGYWDGERLPEPDSCPTIVGAQLCGGHCGGCPAGQICTGRSTRHAYSMCLPDGPESCDASGQQWPCPPGTGCFTYTVEPEAQALADMNGYCLDLGTCYALAAELPGGATCTEH